MHKMFLIFALVRGNSVYQSLRGNYYPLIEYDQEANNTACENEHF